MKSIISVLNRTAMYVLLGTLLCVSSALVASVSLRDNNRKVRDLNREISTIDRRIEEQRANNLAFEYEGHIGTLILLINELTDGQKISTLDAVLDRYLKQTILSGRISPQEASDLKTQILSSETAGMALKRMFEITDRNKREALEIVENLHQDRFVLIQRRALVESQNNSLLNYSLFLQILGLILILSRNVLTTSSAPSLPLDHQKATGQTFTIPELHKKVGD
jgi:hypothetical protein